jgi:CRP-like cAMP-binding protein
MEKNIEGKYIEVKKEFTFILLQAVTEKGSGYAFGELALMNDKPRSASVLALEETHLAILDKKDFKSIMEKSLKSKFAEQVSFLSGVPFLVGMTRIAKEKLSLLMKPVKYSFGQTVIREGESLDKIYFIFHNSEFEIHKTI